MSAVVCCSCCCRCFQLGFLSACFDCLNITFLTQLQGNGLEEGADLCVFYTHLTKLLNLIALRGIISVLWKFDAVL